MEIWERYGFFIGDYFMKKFGLAGFFFVSVLFAGPVVKRVTVQTFEGDQPTVKRFLVVASSVETLGTRAKEETLTLASIDATISGYEVATTGQVVFKSRYPMTIPGSLKGVMPNGTELNVPKMEMMFHTDEVKPKGAMLATYCGMNITEQVNAPGEVCIEASND